MRHGAGRPFTSWAWGPLRLLHKMFYSRKVQLPRRISSPKDDDDHRDIEGKGGLTGYGVQRSQAGGCVGYIQKHVGKSSASILPICRPSFTYNPVIAVLLLTTLWVGLYSGSLVGGDLHSVIHQLGRIAACFFSAIACFLAAIYITLFDSTIPGRLRAILLGIICISWNVMFLYDHGGSLQHHGAYNILVFAIFVIPALCITSLEYGAWRLVGTKKLVAVHIPFFIAVTFATVTALWNATLLWDQGFRGEHMLPLTNRTTCTPVHWGLPWVDVYPKGTQNVWASSLVTCHDSSVEAKALNFYVNFTTEGALITSCNSEIGRSYTPLPSTLDWPKADKLIEENYEGKLPRPFNKNVMDKVREAGEISYESLQPVLLPDGIESVIIRCGGVEKLVARVRPDPIALERTSPREEAADLTNVTTQPAKLDVVIIFIDAVSRRGFHRRLRRSASALQEADNKGLTRLYQFFRYSVVEFCTEPNSRAMFQGTIERQTEVAPPVWEDFASSGWVSLYTADTCQDLPAAYMSNRTHRSFDHELLAPFCHSDFFAEDANPFGNFKGPYSICARCLKGQQVHEHELHYLQSFQAAYPDRPKFSLAWLLEGHEGTTEVLRLLDDGLASYLNDFTAWDWNNTALIIAADHGLHMGLNFGLSQNGAVEHRNPFMAVMLPPWFTEQEDRHRIMTKNQQRMVTGLDLYRTLQGIRMAGLTNTEKEQWVDVGESHRLKNGMDLLHTVVPEGRTCKDAAIVDEYCQCL